MERRALLFPILGGLLLTACTSTTEVNPANQNTTVEVVRETEEARAARAGARRLEAAWGYLQVGNLDRAKVHLEAAMEHIPDSAELHSAQGYYFDQVGEFERAEMHFQKSVRLAPNDGDVLNRYGVFLCRQNKFAKAEDMFERTVKLPAYANVASSLENAGLCAQRAKNPVKAETYFQRALRYNPNMSASVLELGLYEAARKNFPRARQYWQQYQSIGRENARSVWLGLQVEHALGNKDAVASLGLKLERLFPETEEAALYASSKDSWLK